MSSENIRKKLEIAKEILPKILEKEAEELVARKSHEVARKKLEIAREILPKFTEGYNVIDYIEDIILMRAM